MRFFIIVVLSVVFYACGSSEQNYNSPPEWSKGAAWYQIFPERFFNGDPANDPQVEDMAGAWPYFVPEGWQTSPWAADWYKLQPWEQGLEWHRHFDWAKPNEDNFNATAGLRRYGGDLEGVIRKLDYIQQLGITAIYFNPLFESPSLHKYDASMYHHIDNNFGPDPAGDREIWAQEDPGDPTTWQWTSADKLFLTLIEECHRRGIRVIIDGVFNHCGNTFWAFQDLRKNQQNSRYKDWFTVNAWDDPATPEDEFSYEGWHGIPDLPEFRENESGLVAGPSEHVHQVIRRWMDPNGDGDPSDGVDGWRLDVAEMVNIEFWKTFRGWVRKINPEAYLTGELWWEDWENNKMFNAAPYFDGAFDAVMNYRTTRAIKHFAYDVENQITPQGFVDSLNNIYRDYRWENVLASMNLMGSHDTDRPASQIVNPDRWYDHDANPAQNRDYDVRRPNDTEWLKLKLVSGIQLTLPGAPMIFYGDEAGMWGADDPDVRKPMIWSGIIFEKERSHPFGETRPEDPVVFHQDIFNWHANLLRLRNNYAALRVGSIEFIHINNETGTLGYRREHSTGSVIVLANSSGSPQEITLTSEQLSGRTTVEDKMSGQVYRTEGDTLKLTMSSYQVLVLR